ncbi:hypothetical protein YC2023_063465 [Brassica napus]
MESGEVFTYGHNSVFSCGHGTYNPVLKPKFVEYFWNTNTPCKQVKVHTMCTIFLTIDGRLYTVRDNRYDQLGLGDRTNQTLPTLSFFAVTNLKLVDYFWNTNTTCKQVEVNSWSTLLVKREGQSHLGHDDV